MKMQLIIYIKITHNVLLKLLLINNMSYEETVKDIENTFGMLPGFMRNTPKDILPQMWPLFKKYQMGTSIIPQKYREMMMLAAAAATKCPYCQTYHKEVAKMYGATVEELNELAVIIGQTSFWSNVLHIQNYDYNTFVRELQQIGEHLAKKSNKR
jgi:AhpD family alkylhydroperoxidase